MLKRSPNLFLEGRSMWGKRNLKAAEPTSEVFGQLRAESIQMRVGAGQDGTPVAGGQFPQRVLQPAAIAEHQVTDAFFGSRGEQPADRAFHRTHEDALTPGRLSRRGAEYFHERIAEPAVRFEAVSQGNVIQV